MVLSLSSSLEFYHCFFKKICFVSCLLIRLVTREEGRLLSSPKCVPLVTLLGWVLPNMPGLGKFLVKRDHGRDV